MKYFNIDESARYHTADELTENAEWGRRMNWTERFGVLEEQLRPLGLQPFLYMDGSGFEIQTASKSFLNRQGSHKRQLSKKALEYMEFCNGRN